MGSGRRCDPLLLPVLKPESANVRNGSKTGTGQLAPMISPVPRPAQCAASAHDCARQVSKSGRGAPGGRSRAARSALRPACHSRRPHDHMAGREFASRAAKEPHKSITSFDRLRREDMDDEVDKCRPFPARRRRLCGPSVPQRTRSVRRHPRQPLECKRKSFRRAQWSPSLRRQSR